jgi:hypothetical protein
MRIFVFAVLIVVYLKPSALSQTSGFVNSGAIAGSGESLPFWMITNNYGRFTPQSVNAWLDAGIFADTIHITRKLKLDMGGELFGRYDGSWHGQVQQGYAELKYGILNFYAGRKEEHFGSQDPELSSGFVMWSGNALPVPQVSISTNDFVKVPFTRGFIEFKAGLSHGWLGDKQYVKDAYMHHKYLYFRFGGSHSLHFTAGVHHFAQWAGNSPEWGELPSGMNNFLKVFLARDGKDTVPGVPSYEWDNRFGNHLGTKDISVDYRFKGGLTLKLYWQNFIEDVTGLGFRNASDGLIGIQAELPERFKIGYEFFRSVSRLTLKDGTVLHGADDYFNNGIYRSGWTYQGYTIGNPLITSPVLLNTEYPGQIINNRVEGHVVHLAWFFNTSRLDMRYSFTKNYGNNSVLFEQMKIQSSMLLSWKKGFLGNKIWGRLSAGWDKGELLGDHFGLGLEVEIKL